MVYTAIGIVGFFALLWLCGYLASLCSWVYWMAACAFCFGGAYLSSSSFRSTLARIPAWKKNLVLMSVLFSAGLVWYTFFDTLSRGFR